MSASANAPRGLGGKGTTCTHHCLGCGSHFSSLAGFDAHRQGDYGHDRWCEEPEDVVRPDGAPRLVALTTAGVCRLASPHSPKIGVTVWTDGTALEQARRRFRRAAA